MKKLALPPDTTELKMQGYEYPSTKRYQSTGKVVTDLDQSQTFIVIWLYPSFKIWGFHFPLKTWVLHFFEARRYSILDIVYARSVHNEDSTL